MKVKLGLWSIVGLTIVYLYIMNLYFDYVVSRNVDGFLQMVVTFVVLFYTVFHIQLIVNSVINLINKKEKND
jgi:hypothetical protein